MIVILRNIDIVMIVVAIIVIVMIVVLRIYIVVFDFKLNNLSIIYVCLFFLKSLVLWIIEKERNY